MTADGTPGPKNQPHVLGVGALATAVDLGIISDYAAVVGNRGAGNTADRLAWPAWEGMTWWDTDLKIEFLHDGSGWVEWSSGWIPYTPSSLTITVGAGSALTRYKWEAGRVRAHGRFTIGSGGNISGIAKLALPVTRAALSHNYEPSPELGHAYSGALATPTTTNFLFPILADGSSTTVVRFGYGTPSVTGDVTNAMPFAVNSGSVYEANFTYDRA